MGSCSHLFIIVHTYIYFSDKSEIMKLSIVPIQRVLTMGLFGWLGSRPFGVMVELCSRYFALPYMRVSRLKRIN